MPTRIYIKYFMGTENEQNLYWQIFNKGDIFLQFSLLILQAYLHDHIFIAR